MLTTRLDPTWAAVAAESVLAGSGTYLLADVGGDQAIVIRGRDGAVRAFHNVCKHRGSRVLEEPEGCVVRLQCPYHAWVYDQQGALVRAKHTEDLDDFDPADYGLTPMDVAIADGVVHVRPLPSTPSVLPQGPLTDAEIAAVARPYREASLLPGRAYHDPAIYEFELANWFRRDWVCLGRVEDAGPGTAPFETQIGRERIVVARDADGRLGAQRPAAPAEPVNVTAWQGFVFASLAADPPAFETWIGDLVQHVERFDFTPLRRGHRETYDVAANWKLIVENYSECYHCPGIHPQLNKITPYDTGADYETVGAWQGGWMELREGYETMALEGAHRVGPPMCGVTPVDERRVDYLVVWPNVFLAIHPDYLLVHRLELLGPDRTRIVCDWLFEPETLARPAFDPSQAIAFWDMTNRQDWHVCELQQQGTASLGFRAGRFANNEPSVHAFDRMCADRYRGDTFSNVRTVRDRYDVPPEK